MPTAAANRLWAPDDLLAAHDAWLAGWGDLAFAAFRRPVPPIVQLGVLAHADWRRLDDLRSAGRLSRASRTWGSAALQVVDAVLRAAGSPHHLVRLQEDDLRPLERRLLNRGQMDLGAADLEDLVGRALGLPAAG
ncbi:MAG: hypothetical protein ABR571_12055 [Jatrophihabitans sp.]|uniref:hypothetical protein n=1 Tax=Jatrophihabitans sp. TaxID=1932789 RepID=UPI00391173F8